MPEYFYFLAVWTKFDTFYFQIYCTNKQRRGKLSSPVLVTPVSYCSHLKLVYKYDQNPVRHRDRMVVGFITTYAINAYHH